MVGIGCFQTTGDVRRFQIQPGSLVLTDQRQPGFQRGRIFIPGLLQPAQRLFRLSRLFRQSGLPRAAAPSDGCDTANQDDNAPRITSPLRGVAHAVRTQKPEPLVLRAEAAAGTRTIYWFADDALVGQSAPGEGITWLPPLAQSGKRHTLRAVSDQGQSETREITVDIIP